MSKALKRVAIDYEKIEKEIAGRTDYSLQKLSEEIGHNASYMSKCKKADMRMAEPVEKLIAEKLERPAGYFILKEKAEEPDGQMVLPGVLQTSEDPLKNAKMIIAVMEREHKELIESLQKMKNSMDELIQYADAIWKDGGKQ